MEPLRPSDHIDQAPTPTDPPLDAAGWARFLWRQLTSMRTALLLLLLLALAAIPGSLVPQRSSDPNGVLRYERDDPELYEILDALQLFDTYTSVWFSAIYILLFISLVGCILPRAKHHLHALRQPPPKTPSRLERLEGYRTATVPGTVPVAELVSRATTALRQAGYRVAPEETSVAGERGYARETANLVFHFALVGVLLSVAFGSGFKYYGQKVIVEGQSFTNQLASFDTFNPGTFVDETSLKPFALQLENFDADYRLDPDTGQAQPLDFAATMTVTTSESESTQVLKVNGPLSVEDTRVYLLGNGFAPWLTITDPAGREVFSQPVVFLPQDQNLTSLGVVKVPDGLSEQVGMLGFFYPSAVVLPSGALSSLFPEPQQPVVTLNVFTGDLGLNEGVPRNVYSLDTESMTQVAGGETGVPPIVLGLGQSQDLPGDLGTIAFEALPRFVSVDVHRDPTQLPVALSTLFLIGGLVSSLFVVRRRAWIRVVPVAGGADHLIEVAGLSKGDDPGLDQAMEDLLQRFLKAHDSRVEG